MSFHFKTLFGLLLLGTTLAATGCAADTGDDEDEASDETASELEALREGVNSKGCRRSAYNCGLHPGSKSQRVLRAGGEEDWGIDAKWLVKEGFVDPATKEARTPVVDGNGDLMGLSKKTEFTLNYGQTRRMKNRTWVMALSAGVGSAGWVPIDAFVNAESLRNRVGEVNAQGAGMKDMACYEVKSTYDKDLDSYKVVKGARANESMEPNDYLPMKRSNGKVYINLAFSVPGDALGAPAVDIYPAGTKFQRLDVPTWDTGAPSLDVKLYSRTKGSTAFNDLAKRRMKFLYGYVKSDTGSVRYGWMPQDALTPSNGCANR